MIILPLYSRKKNKEYKVALILAKVISVSNFPKKDENTIRFFVDETYQDRSGFDFKKHFE